VSLLVKRVGIPFGGTQHRNISGINDDSPERVKIDFLVLLTAYFISVRPLLDILRDTYVGPVTGTFAAGLAIVVCGTFALLARAIVIQGHPVTHLVLGYAAWSVISGTVAIIWLDAGDFVSALLRLLIVLVGYLSFFELGIKRPDVVPKLLALPAVPACLLALIQLHLNIGLPRSEWVSEQELNRVLGPFEHPNALAIYGAVILALAVGTIVSSDWRGNSSKAWALLAGLCVLAIIPTYARIVWLSIPVALVLMGIVSRRLMLPLGILLLGGVAAVILWRQQIETRLSGYSSLSYRRS
jgi:hypothetical protein